MDIPDHPPHSCRFCQRLVLDFGEKDDVWVERTLALRSDPDPSEKAKEGRQKFCDLMSLRYASHEHPLSIGNTEVIFDFSMGEAREAATEGCLFLENLVQRITSLPCEDDVLLACVKETELYINFQLLTGTELSGCRSWSRHSPEVKPSVQKIRPSFSGFARFDIVARAGTQSSKEFPTRPFNTDPSSESSVRMMRSWLHECLVNHPTCRKPVSTFLPTRLLRFTVSPESGEMVQLWDTKDQSDVPYIALSYCWGEKGQVNTTVNNIQSHQQGIAVTSLPRTVRDALQIASDLEIPNLWIDSLCIIQNDPVDKAAEIARMPLIYSQATLTLKVSRSSDVHKGFLGKRTAVAEALIDRQYRLPFSCPNGSCEMIDIFPLFYKNMIEPLDHRAWALQERFLSSRVLDIGTYQTRWICQGVDDDVPIDGFRSITDPGEQGLDHLSRATLMLLERKGPIKRDTSYEPDRLWRQLVEAYSSRSLTFQSDRLPAISGLATCFATLLDDQYHAGLWRSNLPLDLLWKSSFKYVEQEGGTDMLGLDGPSWSWCSVPGPVHYPWSDTGLSSPVASLNFIDIRTDLKLSGCQYGGVCSGSLTVDGRFQEANLFSTGSQRYPWCANMLKQVSHWILPSQTIPSWVKIDPRASVKSGRLGLPVLLFRVLSSEDGSQGLVLSRISKTVFSRIGTFDCNRNTTRSLSRTSQYYDEGEDVYGRFAQWFDDGEVRTITIV